MGRPHGRSRVNPRSPQAQGVCDWCGTWYTYVDLQRQYQYAGTGLRDTGFLHCRHCLDEPQPQLLARTFGPDPMPIVNPRGEPFAIDEA